MADVKPGRPAEDGRGDDILEFPPLERDKVVCIDPKTGRNTYRPTSSVPELRRRDRERRDS